ncbi:MAG: kelch repeat-containing protein [Pseudomonadota bacterium]
MLNRRSFSLGGAAALMLAASPAVSSAGETGVWSQRADMPFPVQEIYPARFLKGGAEVIVNAGGVTPKGLLPLNFSDEVVIYDPSQDVWSSGPTLPAARHHLVLVAAGGALYAIGGFSGDMLGPWRMQSTVWRLDDLQGDWSPAPDLPAPQGEAHAAAVGGRIHVIGGRTPKGEANRKASDHRDTDAHWAFDIAAGTWEACRPLPTARNSGACVYLDGLIYVVSGRMFGGENTPVCEAYDPKTDAWRTVAPLPAPARQDAPRGQGGLAAAAWNGEIVALGGEWFSGAQGVYADAWAYNPQQDAWRAVAPMPRPRHGLGAVALSDGVYVIGGATEPSGKGTSPYLDRFVI